MSSSPVPPPPPTPPRDDTPRDLGHIPMTEEMDSAKWTLPPVVPVLIAFVAVGAIVALLLWRTQPQATVEGNIVQVAGAALPNAETPRTFAVVHLRIKNFHEKPLYIKSLKATLKAGGSEYSDDAAAASDHARYLQAIPELAPHQIAGIKGEDKITQNSEQTGMAMFSFPVTREAFDAREQLTLTVELYDRAPLVLSEKK